MRSGDGPSAGVQQPFKAATTSAAWWRKTTTFVATHMRPVECLRYVLYYVRTMFGALQDPTLLMYGNGDQ